MSANDTRAGATPSEDGNRTAAVQKNAVRQQLQVTDKMVEAFVGTYERETFHRYDCDAIRAALTAALAHREAEAVAWHRTEKRVHQDVAPRQDVTLDPELAELWRHNEYTESLNPLYAAPPAQEAVGEIEIPEPSSSVASEICYDINRKYDHYPIEPWMVTAILSNFRYQTGARFVHRSAAPPAVPPGMVLDVERVAKWVYEAGDMDGCSVAWADKRNSRVRAQTRRQVREVLSAVEALTAAQESR